MLGYQNHPVCKIRLDLATLELAQKLLLTSDQYRGLTSCLPPSSRREKMFLAAAVGNNSVFIEKIIPFQTSGAFPQSISIIFFLQDKKAQTQSTTKNIILQLSLTT